MKEGRRDKRILKPTRKVGKTTKKVESEKWLLKLMLIKSRLTFSFSSSLFIKTLLFSFSYSFIPLFSRPKLFFVPKDCWEWRFFFFTFSLLHPPLIPGHNITFSWRWHQTTWAMNFWYQSGKPRGRKNVRLEEILSFSLKLDPSSSSSHSSPSLILSYLAIAISLCSLSTDSFFFTYMKANFEI